MSDALSFDIKKVEDPRFHLKLDSREGASIEHMLWDFKCFVEKRLDGKVQHIGVNPNRMHNSDMQFNGFVYLDGEILQLEQSGWRVDPKLLLCAYYAGNHDGGNYVNLFCPGIEYESRVEMMTLLNGYANERRLDVEDEVSADPRIL